MSQKMPNLSLDSGPAPLETPDAYHMIGVKRSLAYLIDLTIMGILLGVLYLALVIAGFMSFGFFWLFIPIAATVVLMGYPIWHLSKPKGATPGMAMMGLEMLRMEEEDAPVWLAPFIRTLLFYAIGSLTAWLALFYSYFDPNRRCLHDILSSTLVINSNKKTDEVRRESRTDIKET